MNFIVVNKFIIFVFMIRSILTLMFMILFFGCGEKFEKQYIQHDKKCVIDSVKLKPRLSTLDVSNTYMYYTNCGLGFSIRDIKSYNVGDTITFSIYETRDNGKNN